MLIKNGGRKFARKLNRITFERRTANGPGNRKPRLEVRGKLGSKTLYFLLNVERRANLNAQKNIQMVAILE